MFDRARNANDNESMFSSNESASCDEWADYVPEEIHISETRRRELREEHERYLDELIREVGEPMRWLVLKPSGDRSRKT